MPIHQDQPYTSRAPVPPQPAVRAAGSAPPPIQLDPSVTGEDQAQQPYTWQTVYPQQQAQPQADAAGPYAPRQNGRQPGAPPPAWDEEPEDDEDNEYDNFGGPAKPGYHVPRTGVVSRPRRSGVPYVILAVLVLGLTAFAAIRHFAPQEAMYGYVSAGVLSSRYTGSALLVRDETVYTQESISQIDYKAEEGTNVDRTKTICTVYTSGFNTRELTTLKRYRDQIKEYHKTLISSSGAARDVRLTTLDTQVREQAKTTRAMIQEQHGNLLNQEEQLTETLQSRQSYLRQKYPDDQKLSRLYDDENNQMQRISSWTKQYAADSDGIVSFYTDGYEPVLNMNQYLDYSPSEVRNMYNGFIPTNPAATRNTVSIYRLVREGRWAVLMLCDDTDWTPLIGQTYKLLIESFENTVVDATVDSFTRAGGELLVRLSVENGDVRPILYIRSCEVQLGENVDSLTVPTRALYTQMGQTGVVIVDEYGNNYFTPVTVISTQGEVSHIIPKNSGVLYEDVVVKLF